MYKRKSVNYCGFFYDIQTTTYTRSGMIHTILRMQITMYSDYNINYKAISNEEQQ